MYYSTTLVLNLRVLLMYTDTVKEVPGYPVQNSPCGSFLFWGGSVGRGGNSICYCLNGMPRRKPWKMCVNLFAFVFYVVSHLSFNFLCLLLLYSIYLCGLLGRNSFKLQHQGDNVSGAQSRQSAKLFSSRRDWDSPNPSPAGECAPPPFWSRGKGHTRWRKRGWESPNSGEGTYTLVLCMYMYFVIGSQQSGA